MNDEKIKIILQDETSTPSCILFNPNEWSDGSKGIIESCFARYGLLHYSSMQIEELLKRADDLCRRRFQEFIKSGSDNGRCLENYKFLVEYPLLHNAILSFLAAAKSLLDSIVQLLYTEKITSNLIHGFHKKGNDPGGKILKALQTGVSKEKTEKAIKIGELIRSGKIIWIDQLVNERDALEHPKKQIHQIMLEMLIIKKCDQLELLSVINPKIDNINCDEYARKILKDFDCFIDEFLKLIRS